MIIESANDDDHTTLGSSGPIVASTVTANLATMGPSLGQRQRGTGKPSIGSVLNRIKCWPIDWLRWLPSPTDHLQLSPQVRLITSPILLAFFLSLVVSPLVFTSAAAYGTHTRKLSFTSRLLTRSDPFRSLSLASLSAPLSAI